MRVKKQQLEPDMEQHIGSKLGKEYVKAVYCHPVYLTYMHIISCEMLGWMKHKLIARRNISNLRHTVDTTLMAESEEELSSLLMKVMRRVKQSWLKSQHSRNENHGIQSHHFMADRWRTNGKHDRLYFGGAPKSLPMVTAAMKLKDTCSLKRRRKVMTKLDSILKSRDVNFANKGPSSQSYGFSSSRV